MTGASTVSALPAVKPLRANLSFTRLPDSTPKTGFCYTLSLISGKHKMVILYCLMEFQVVRFNELKRYLKTISDKTLSTNLKELEADQLIVRTEYPQIPPKVEYSLSERGKSLMAVLDQLCIWGEKNRLDKN